MDYIYDWLTIIIMACGHRRLVAECMILRGSLSVT
jgi:hypothetical protein